MGVLIHILPFFLSFCILFLVFQTSHSATLLVDGFTHWSNPKANIGDTIIFEHKNKYNVYIFRTNEAYNNCNFNQATPLSNPNSTTYTWHPSRPGTFYFAFYNGTTKPCQQGQKLAVVITPLSNSTTPVAVKPANPPEIPPPATPGGVVSSSPAYPWPFQPREKASGPAADLGMLPGPALAPTGQAGSIPFINSNPAVPLPTGEVDSATIGPLPISANLAPQGVKALGVMRGLIYLSFVMMVAA